MKLVTIFICILFICTANGDENHFNTSDNNDYFHKIRNDILKTAKNIIETLNPKKNLLELAKMKMLLTMHNDLSRITQNNYEMYEEIKNITHVTVCNKNMSKLFNLTGLTSIMYKIRLKKFETKRNGYKDLEDNISGDFEDDTELKEFVYAFVAKLNKLSLKDLYENPTIEKSRNETFLLNKNLKVWRPSAFVDDHLTHNTDTRRIYKGKSVRIRKYPFMASIHINDEFACSGTIISKSLIITAASCLKLAYLTGQASKQSTLVRIGSDYFKKNGYLTPISQVYFHPLFNPKNLKNNLAIIRTEQPPVRRTKRIRKMTLNKDFLVPQSNDEVTILGWGARDESQSLLPNAKLTHAKLNIYNLARCIDTYSSYYVTEKHFCAGFVTRPGGACNRDVGAPGIINGVLAGVVSFGPAICGNPNEPTVFTKLASYIVWIEDIMNQPTPKLNRKSNNPRKNMVTGFGTPHSSNEIPVMNNAFYKNYKLIHKNAKKEAVMVVKDIINEIVITNDNRLDQVLYKDLYEDFNALYHNTARQSMEDLDESISMTDIDIDKDSDDYDEPKHASRLYTKEILTTTIATSSSTPMKIYPVDRTTRMMTKRHTTNKANVTTKNILRDLERDWSAKTSDDNNSTSDNYEDYSGLSIDTSLVKRDTIASQSLSTDEWGLPKMLLLLGVTNPDGNIEI